MKQERGWLIETPGKTGIPYWWNGYDGWTHDTTVAVRFCRKQDADKVIAYNEDSQAVAPEHIWESFDTKDVDSVS